MRKIKDTFVPSSREEYWSHNVRSYVLQPYTLVKDLRTGVETADVAGVLDGDLDQFLKAALVQGVGKPRNPNGPVGE